MKLLPKLRQRLVPDGTFVGDTPEPVACGDGRIALSRRRSCQWQLGARARARAEQLGKSNAEVTETAARADGFYLLTDEFRRGAVEPWDR